MIGRAAAPVVLAVVWVTACEGGPPRARLEEYDEEESTPQIFVEENPPDPTTPPPAIAEGESEHPAPRQQDPELPPIRPASHGDDDYNTDDPVIARRYVYRVRMIVPAGLGDTSARITVPAAELYIDVSHERLRARFAGNGWPVAAGSEVRLRRDRPGVYVFDGEGGRPLEPGQLATWFEGGPVSRRGPPLYIFATHGSSRHQTQPPDEESPGDLVCALFAELAAEPRESFARRCEPGAPQMWRIGFWRAEQTARVPVELARSALRADERNPPRPIPHLDSRAFLEPAAFRRLRGGPAPTDEPPEGAPPEGLRVRNETVNRVIVGIDGVAAGFVDAGAEGWFVGLSPGHYDVGSIRPLGAVVQRGRPVRVPGIHRVCDGRCPRPP